MSEPLSPKDESQIFKDLAGQYVQKSSRVYTNVDQEIIFTTEDKLRLCLMQHLSTMETKKGWIAPLGVFLTILVVFPTTEFRPFFSFSADMWKAAFVIGGVWSFIWLIKASIAARASSTLEDVVANIKRTSAPQEYSAVFKATDS